MRLRLCPCEARSAVLGCPICGIEAGNQPEGHGIAGQLSESAAIFSTDRSVCHLDHSSSCTVVSGSHRRKHTV